MSARRVLLLMVGVALLATPTVGFGASSVTTARWVTLELSPPALSPLRARHAALTQNSPSTTGRLSGPSPRSGLRALRVEPRQVRPGERLPAVVMLHGCRGLGANHQDWARRLASWGYVALLIDSHYSRHAARVCEHLDTWAATELVGGRVFDAYAGLRSLATDARVDKRRILVMSWGIGSALSAVARAGAQALFEERFAAAIAISPDCAKTSSGHFMVPVMVLVGAKDDWHPADRCRAMRRSSPEPDQISLEVLADAYFGFDDTRLWQPRELTRAVNYYRTPARGARLAYNQPMHRRSTALVKSFVEEVNAPRWPSQSITSNESSSAYKIGTGELALDSEGTWVVHPRKPGPDLPAVGASLFDRLFKRDGPGGPEYHVPYPFERLLAHLRQQLVQTSYQDGLQISLIPLGRSLQRHTAAPNFFASPRVVVAVDGDARRAADSVSRPLRDRLFLGFQERGRVIEVISYNETAARFEFQLVEKYGPEGTPQVHYASRELCTSCHQNQGPIFPEAAWDETNSAPRTAERLARERSHFYGLAAAGRGESAARIDNSTDRANLLSAWQLLWRDGCGTDPGARLACRRALFLASVQRRLNGAEFDREDGAFKDYLQVAARAWREQWPEGLLVPNPDLPNRVPLRTHNPVEIPHELDPLRKRGPIADWRWQRERDLVQLVEGLAAQMPEVDIGRLDRFLATQHGKAADGAAEVVTLDCEVDVYGAAVGQLVVECVNHHESARVRGRLSFERLASGDPRRPLRLTEGRIEEIVVGQGERFTDLRVDESASLAISGDPISDDLGDERPRVWIRPRSRNNDRSLRMRNGDRIAALELSWVVKSAVPRGLGQRHKGNLRVVLSKDFGPVRHAVSRMMRQATDSSPPVVPLRVDQLMGELFFELGVIPASPDLRPAPTPPKVLAGRANSVLAARADSTAAMTDGITGISGTDDFSPPLSRMVAGLKTACGACHSMPTDFPPGFLEGESKEVSSKLKQCASRIFVRLSMWREPSDHRLKSPMPPDTALPYGTASHEWPHSEAYQALLADASALVQSTGVSPDLERLMAGGYESLRSCMLKTE